MDEQQSFQYTYSAGEQAEVEAIRKKYLPQEEDKMERLRQLDSIPTTKAQIWALTLGILGVLLLGSGMSLFMSELGAQLGLGPGMSMVIGIPVGIVGLILVALAYPTYNRILQKEQARIAPEILRLTEELMQ